jgi:RNA-directed DNA polymerase
MSQLLPLRLATSLYDVAPLLGFTSSGLAYVIYGKHADTKYVQFEILKRGGGTRTISAPTPDLKLAQRRLADLLQNCVEEINATTNRRDHISHGFKRKRSIITNAVKHRKRRFVFNVDLQDFFGTINFGRVRGFFIKDKNFSLSERVATILAQIACHNNSLPQGSPCSPVISNLIGHVLDIQLSRLAFKEGCTYTRYADDLTFSTNKPQFPQNIAKSDPTVPHVWAPGEQLANVIMHSGFAINQQKTRLQYRGSRQEVTGLVVNIKANIRSEYRRAVRAMAHRLFMTGEFDIMTGATVHKGTLRQLHGMLGHIDRVDWYNAERVPGDHKEEDPVGISTKENLYRRFLVFQEFYWAARPTIVCEGKTDNIYLKHAIRSLAAEYPSLKNLRIFKYPDTSTARILKLRGGSGDMRNFIDLYRKELRRFKAVGLQYPVMLLVDNDDGAGKIKGIVREITKSAPLASESFTRIIGNLYLVLTPPKADGGQSNIEDCFPEQVKAVRLNNKSFSAENHYNIEKQFGKAIFSQYVDANAANIDFNGFRGILARLDAAIAAHAAIPKLPVQVPAG